MGVTVLNREEREIIEKMIDKTNLMEVLNALAEICNEKAEHIRANWQDSKTARPWDHDAKIIQKAAEKVMC